MVLSHIALGLNKCFKKMLKYSIDQEAKGIGVYVIFISISFP